jgi:hypothetical protein
LSLRASAKQSQSYLCGQNDKAGIRDCFGR